MSIRVRALGLEMKISINKLLGKSRSHLHAILNFLYITKTFKSDNALGKIKNLISIVNLVYFVVW